MRYQKWYPPPLSSAVFVLALSAVSPPVYSQVLVTEPGCGKVGDTVRITGSGWAEPNPVCEYRFFFDGTEFIGRQPDGLFGPPNSTGTIPAGATPGEHTIKVELRLTSDGSLLQCRQTKIKVVADIRDPWTVTASGGTGISISLNPTDVCDITPCSKIVFVQVKQPLGEKSDGTTRPLTHAEQGFRNAAALDMDLTTAGYSVDYVFGERDPYYNGDDSADGGMQGVQNGMPKPATMTDTPSRGDSAYPTGITKIILNFEVAAFCAAGTNQGELLGITTWKWERPKGGSASSTVLSTTRNQPSQSFLDALSHWNSNASHPFTLPAQTSPTKGGEPCTN